MATSPQPTLFYMHRPAAPLDRFVERLWYWEGEPPAHARDRLLPSGSASLIINLAEDEIRNYAGRDDDQLERFPGAVLVGAHSRYSVIDTREQRAVLGVSFRPGGMWPFFDPSADELHNDQIGLGDLWGSAGATLRERILAASTPQGKLMRLAAELLEHAVRPFSRRPEIDVALCRLTHAPHEQAISTLSGDVGLSARRFTRLFTLEVGLTPKLYARIKRFEMVVRQMNGSCASLRSPHSHMDGYGASAALAHPGAPRHSHIPVHHPRSRHSHIPVQQRSVIDWTSIAQHCGYFDQSHLIRDCKALSGFTPTELANRHIAGGHHVAI
jgi:AraC-like DNA-binding protein